MVAHVAETSILTWWAKRPSKRGLVELSDHLRGLDNLEGEEGRRFQRIGVSPSRVSQATSPLQGMKPSSLAVSRGERIKFVGHLLSCWAVDLSVVNCDRVLFSPGSRACLVCELIPRVYECTVGMQVG